MMDKIVNDPPPLVHVVVPEDYMREMMGTIREELKEMRKLVGRHMS